MTDIYTSWNGTLILTSDININLLTGVKNLLKDIKIFFTCFRYNNT